MKASRAWSQKLHRTGGHRNATPGGGTQGLMCTGTQGKKSSDFTGARPHLPASLGGFPGEVEGSCGSLLRHGPIQHPKVSRVGKPGTPQPKQTINWVGTQPHPSADRLLKVFLSPQLPLNTPLDMALPARGTRPSSTYQPVGRHQSLPAGSLHKPLRTASSTRGQTPEARGTIILQPVGLQTQKDRQNETAEEYVPGEGTR